MKKVNVVVMSGETVVGTVVVTSDDNAEASQNAYAVLSSLSFRVEGEEVTQSDIDEWLA